MVYDSRDVGLGQQYPFMQHGCGYLHIPDRESLPAQVKERKVMSLLGKATSVDPDYDPGVSQ
jgi:hypothetical protein